ncbi:hypothetical protein Tco_0926991 [Tanacetum coccineum]|uniref:Uncharacterized protein n=1 Tax=Tanacetum coccineum TaxID=301880 RepID=A0ABQ5DE06_9ASTR
MSTYLKNMGGYKHNQLKNKSFDDIQKLFDKAMKRVNMFVDMDTELVEGSEVRAEAEIAQESSSKRADAKLEQEKEVAIDAIPLVTKPPSIVDYKIHKEGNKTYYQIIKADGSSKIYLVFSHMLKTFDREDLETLWKLVKAKHGSTRPEEGYERVLWGNLKTIFDPHVEDQVWRNQQDYRVLDWKIYDSCGVHSLRMQHMHIHMLVEKRYPFTPAIITDMLNKKLQCSANPPDPHHIPTIIQPSTSQPQKKQKPMKPKRKDTEVPQPSGHTNNVTDEVVYEEMDESLERAVTTATSLDADQERGNINKTQSKATLNELSSLGTSSGSGPRRQETMGDSLNWEITSLKRRVKRLEKKGGSRTHGLKRLYKVGLSRRVESSDEEGLGEEDASKQGRIADIDADAGINLVSTYFDADTDMFGVHDLVGDEVVVESEVAIKAASTIPVSAATTTTTVITDDEITLAKAHAELRSAKLPTIIDATTVTAASTRPKAKGLVIHEQEQAPTPIVSSQQPSQLNVQDKGKGKMVETKPVKKLSKKDQMMIDEELAFKLQPEEEEEEERLAREKDQQLEEANIVSWDNVQAMIDVNYQMAQQMQTEEQEKLSIEEKSKLFVQLLEARKKHFAAMRAQEKRNKPPTKAQKRNTMSTYLKNMARYKQNKLKNKSFDDIQKLFDKAMKRVNTFVDMDT